ncbi:MAG: BamA/TamA family outer membrane protein [Fimbriimonadales bacterium]|nr:BamA/TamA family outer membrane protein [Fimbriimonadales bacterium]
MAQGNQLIGEVVVRGNKSVSEQLIISIIGSKVGQVYQPAQLARDKVLLENTNQFQSVQVYGQLLDNDRWRVVVEVVEWDIISEIRVEGNTVVSSSMILAALRNKVGQVFNPTVLEADARGVSELYRRQGYFARVTQYEPLLEDASILKVVVTEATVERVELVGLTRTPERVVRRAIDTQEGQILSFNQLQEDLKRLADTRWFEEIQPDVLDSDAALGKVVVIINLKETRTGAFNVGVQLDPKNRLAGLFTLNDSNFNGTGKSVGLNLLQSAQGLGTSITIDYGDPFLDKKRTALNTSIYSREQLVFGSSLFGSEGGPLGRFSQRTNGGNAMLSTVLSSNVRAFIGIEAQHVNTRDFVVDPGEEFVFQDGFSAGLNLGFVRNRRDFNQEPARGDWVRVAIEPTFSDVTSLGGQNVGVQGLGQRVYLRTSIDYRVYSSPQPPRTIEQFDEPRRVFAFRAFAATIVGDPPFFEQYFVGGSNGVRGYEEDRFWGKHALLFQAEYRHPIQKSFNAIAFVDYGGAWNGYPSVRNYTQSSTFKMHLGYGVGINFKTPFGPIRLDVGFNDKGKARTHFLIGGSF